MKNYFLINEDGTAFMECYKRDGTTKGLVLIDSNKVQEISAYKWHISKNYACAHIKGDKISLHRFLLSGKIIDHINRDKLDNRVSNLREVSRAQNTINREKIRKKTSSSYKGVSFHSRDRVWTAYITVNKKRISLGIYKSEIDAARTYDRAAIKYFGEYACLNFYSSS